uniref:Glycerol-3-phosphate acyltransferase 2, mitochondrial n=1 Tax=Seriola dumerili TaxID=41447 RepID=A0A3B4TE99_SERDU
PTLPCKGPEDKRNFVSHTEILSWELKIKKKLTTVPPCLGKFRPVVGQCCHQCTPDSLRKKLGQNSSLGFHNLLSVNETQTRYRGWLVRRVCCALFVSGCKVYASPVSNRLERVCQSNRYLRGKRRGVEMPEEIIYFSSSFFLLSIQLFSYYPFLTRFVSWVMLKMFASVFGSIEVNLNHLPDLHKGSLLVYVHVRQSIMDCALIPLVLFCHNLRVPYTVCPLQVHSSSLRSILQKVGVVLLPPSVLTEQEAEKDSLFSPVMTSLVRELLREGQVISVGVSAESGRGGQWLARIRQLIKEGSVPDVSLVPVGISYDCVPKTNIQVDVSSTVLQWLWSVLWGRPGGSVRIHLAQPFSLKCSLSYHLAKLLHPSPLQGVSASVLCRDVSWLTEELLFRNKDVGFGGTLVEIVHYSLSLLAPHLIMAAVPSRKDPFIVARPSLAAILHLTLQAQIVTHAFILEAVGACAVSAMLCEVVRGDMEFDVVLCQSELTERALQLCHLLPPGFVPPCQSSQSFALDAVDSLVRCGILIMEEIPGDVPICDFWKKEGSLTWTSTDDPYHSDSDCEEHDLRSFKISQPSQCPQMLFFLCSMLAGHLRALCWTVTGLDLIDTPLPGKCIVSLQGYNSYLFLVLSEERQKGGVFLGIGSLFQLSENRQKLHRFISQYLYN